MVVLSGCATPDYQNLSILIEPTSTDRYQKATQLAVTETIVPELPNNSFLGETPTTSRIESSASPVETLAVPTPRQNLEASDPASVELASGQLQLVEFFAFW